MSSIEPGPAGPRSLVARAMALLASPAHEWDRIAGEPATAKGLYAGYVCILAAIPPLASLIGGAVFGHSVLGLTFRPIGGLVAGAVVSYLLTLPGVFVLALVIDVLAPSFDGTPDRVQALKVSAYSGTAAWVAGIFCLYPSLAILSALGGLYGLYLLYLGLPRLMKVPHDKALGYTLVILVAALVLFVVVTALGKAVASAAHGVGDIGGPGYTLGPPSGPIDFG